MTAKQIIGSYISFFEKRGHKRIQNAPLIPENDPTTLFTSSGMQPLVPYLLGEKHPQGTRLVNVQNAFRAVDIDEVGDNRHTTFFRMLGNWSLGDYFKTDQLTWIFEFLTNELGLDPKKLYVTVFAGDQNAVLRNQPLGLDTESFGIWKNLFADKNISPIFADMTDKKTSQDIIQTARIFAYGAEKNWWSRSGIPDNMPVGEPGGTDSEVFYDFGSDLKIHENSPYRNQICHPNCDCGRFLEICNSVFMQYKNVDRNIFEELPNRNVDFGGGLERMIMALEGYDVFQTSLFAPVIQSIEKSTNTMYKHHAKEMRIIADHFTAGSFIALSDIKPSNKDQGYILRRVLRRGFDNFSLLDGKDITRVLEAIGEQYKQTDSVLEEKFEEIKNTILEEKQKYEHTQREAKKFIEKKYGTKKLDSNLQGNDKRTKVSGKIEKKHEGDELMGITEISAEDAFTLYTTHGLSPTQIKSLGYTFNDQDFANRMEVHQKLSRSGAAKKFAGGLADHSEKTIMGHTATHLLHQALRDVLGNSVHQSGSNITAERVRFDFNFDRKLTPEELQHVTAIVNEKIKQNLPVHFVLMPLKKAKALGAIGLFDEKYGDRVKVYFIGAEDQEKAYSIEFCGGPHVEFTGSIKRFTIIKEEGLGKGMRRIYAKVE